MSRKIIYPDLLGGVEFKGWDTPSRERSLGLPNLFGEKGRPFLTPAGQLLSSSPFLGDKSL
ncbi:MAG: hypothetical protein RMK19_07205 [Bacteroidia bacterium]|nr:hypothetical protein [Bacteroidia bacterium]MDW8015784.1 hypothetical protein [Bacteroidia bacterium]